MKLTLPTDSAARKRHPLARGPLAYAPAILAGVAEVCIDGNDKHNPGQPLHHARGKSNDHADCIVRHLMDVQDIIAWLERRALPGVLETPNLRADAVRSLLTEVNQLAWRALMLGQEIHETYGGAPLAPGARLPEPPAPVPLPPPLLDYAHEMPVPVSFPQAAMDAAADDIVGQIVSGLPPIPHSSGQPLHGPAGADWRAPAIDRIAWPPLAPANVTYEPDTLWCSGATGPWYFNRNPVKPETVASENGYPSIAEARAAYWADRDASC